MMEIQFLNFYFPSKAINNTSMVNLNRKISSFVKSDLITGKSNSLDYGAGVIDTFSALYLEG